MKELEYNREIWTKMLSLAKKIDQRHENDSFPGFVDGTITMGNRDRCAKRFAKLLAWLLGEDERFYMIHHQSGEMRSISYTPTDYADCSAGFYIEQK